MRFICFAVLLGAAPGLLQSQPKTSNDMQEPPVAAVKPYKLEKHGHTRVDNYYWLRERENPEVIAYLEAENKFLNASIAYLKPLREKLFEEFKTRIKQTDESVPYLRRGYYYYSRMEAGKNYPILARKKALDAPEEILLDGNKLAEGTKYFSIGNAAVSTSNQILAYATDTIGRRFYTYRFRNLASGDQLPDVIKDVTPSGVWAGDNKTFFYVKQDPQTLRSYQVYRHVLGTDPSKDLLIYEEKDVTFRVGVRKTKSEKYILIGSSQTLTTEFRYLDAANPSGEFRIIQPRVRGHEYEPDHYGDSFYIRTNSGKSPNYRLMKTSVDKTEMSNWQEVIGHRADVFIDDFDIFRDYLVVTERRNGLTQLRVRPWSGAAEHYVDFGEPAYAASPTFNYEFNTDLLRFNYSSLTTPNSVYDYNMKTKAKALLKRDEVLGGFDQENYLTERVYAPSHDGVKIPVSVVYRKGTQRNGTAPLFQYAYGSYGMSTDARFNPFAISLLDRGFVYAVAHIRGGQEMGRQWYEDGKLMKKKNTFRDFIAATEYLVANKYADPKRVFAAGGSAGGLLMGAVMNMRPDLYNGMIAAVPFVDVVTTMLDDSSPLTTFEYDEWGNPNEQPAYEYMLSYSPYDQLEKKAYPNLLVTTGLHDSQVQYWEPAKWVAKQRQLRADKKRLLLYTNMEAGHGGASARYKRYEETALQYAFVLDLAGLAR